VLHTGPLGPGARMRQGRLSLRSDCFLWDFQLSTYDESSYFRVKTAGARYLSPYFLLLLLMDKQLYLNVPKCHRFTRTAKNGVLIFVKIIQKVFRKCDSYWSRRARGFSFSLLIGFIYIYFMAIMYRLQIVTLSFIKKTIYIALPIFIKTRAAHILKWNRACIYIPNV
jgi:hypothetical protein